MVNRSATAQSKLAMRYLRPSACVTLAAVMSLTALTADALAAQARHAQPAEEVAPRAAGEPIMAIVSIQSQQVTFYDADGWILRAPVSTGVAERETPAGVFAVLEKEKDHHSTMYDDAWMPNMQRITWNGIALHGGPLPGYAASHGCIRMPYGFAEKLYDKTRIGMRVIISPNDAAPIAFSHPSLFVPSAKAIAAAAARTEPLALEAAGAARTAEQAKITAAMEAREAAALTASLRKLEILKKGADGKLIFAGKALAAAVQARARADDLKQKAAAKAADVARELDIAKTDLKAKQDVTAADAATTDDVVKKAGAMASREPASLRKLESLKKDADAALARADKMLAAADQSKARADEAKQKAAAKVAELAMQFDNAKADLKAKQAAAAAAKEKAKATEAKKVETAKAALDAKLALEPFSIYISRATQKLYVRRNTHKRWPDGGEVFDSSIELPVTIRNPDKPIGTHVFTAMARTDAGLRWTVVTIDNGDEAKNALDRITIPQEVLDRIAPTVSPRSSIIVSDEPLSSETNYRTEFVAVLSNQPQGGFITRRPTTDNFASNDFRSDDGFFFSRRNWSVRSGNVPWRRDYYRVQRGWW
jgi:hypothetical protein